MKMESTTGSPQTAVRSPLQRNGFDTNDGDSDIHNTSSRRNGDENDGNNTRIIGEFPGQNIVKHVGPSKRMDYIVRWYMAMGQTQKL